MSAKYNIQALGIIPAVETPCTLINPHSQSLDWMRNTGHMISINCYYHIYHNTYLSFLVRCINKEKW